MPAKEQRAFQTSSETGGKSFFYITAVDFPFKDFHFRFSAGAVIRQQKSEKRCVAALKSSHVSDVPAQTSLRFRLPDDRLKEAKGKKNNIYLD